MRAAGGQFRVFRQALIYSHLPSNGGIRAIMQSRHRIVPKAINPRDIGVSRVAPKFSHLANSLADCMQVFPVPGAKFPDITEKKSLIFFSPYFAKSTDFTGS